MKNLSLSKKTLFIFGVIFLTFLGNQSFVIYKQITEDRSAFDVINTAARNRTLSQKISTASLSLLKGDPSIKNNIENYIFLLDSSIKALKFGGVVPEIGKSVPALTGEAKTELEKVEVVWKEYKASTNLLLDNDQLIAANQFIGDNYNKLLSANNELVVGLINSTELVNNDPEVVKEIINIAGRNRTLSQQIGLIVFKILQGDKALIPELEETIKLHDQTLNLLANGGEVPGTGLNYDFLDPSLVGLISNIQNIWEPYKLHAQQVVNAKGYLDGIEGVAQNNAKLFQLNDNLVKAIVTEVNLAKDNANQTIFITLVFLLVATSLIILAGYMGINKFIVEPIQRISKDIQQLSFGRVPEMLVMQQKDEIGELAGSTNKLIDNFKSYSSFSSEIGNGNFDYEFKAASEDDELGKSLVDMRNQLKRVEEEGSVRNWKTEGLAKFADILRATDSDLEEFSQAIITNVVQYVGAVQGALYIVNDQEGQDVEIVRKGSYAYGRSKFVEDVINPGQGLVGQVFLEKKHVFLTNVPQDFMKITSGLGDAEPSSVIVLPLMVNEQVMGIIELASFEEFTTPQIEFLSTLGESIAATLNSAKVNENTKVLLIESKSMEENLKSQEEELRQTMEEMQATQDSIMQREEELEGEIARLKKELNKYKNEG